MYRYYYKTGIHIIYISRVECRKVIGSPKKTELSDVMAKSAQQHQVSQVILKFHKKRLDALLASNSLDRIPVESDGDCFINSVILQLGTFTSLTAHEDFRNQLANHISSHRQHYEGYITTENFTAEVADLRTMGHWETSLADVCPLAVAYISFQVMLPTIFVTFCQIWGMEKNPTVSPFYWLI